MGVGYPRRTTRLNSKQRRPSSELGGFPPPSGSSTHRRSRRIVLFNLAGKLLRERGEVEGGEHFLPQPGERDELMLRCHPARRHFVAAPAVLITKELALAGEQVKESEGGLAGDGDSSGGGIRQRALPSSSLHEASSPYARREARPPAAILLPLTAARGGAVCG